ncbi:MAG: hypothetical protein WDN45_07140 [Caulobacteraceae bacterium]
MMDDVDLILVMSVNPGFGGQSFMTSQLKKIETLRAMIDAEGRDIVLEVDGGVTPENRPPCASPPGPRPWSPATPCSRAGPTPIPVTLTRCEAPDGGRGMARLPALPPVRAPGFQTFGVEDRREDSKTPSVRPAAARALSSPL